MSKIDEKRLWIIEARDGAWGANGICKGELVRCGECRHYKESVLFGAKPETVTIGCPHHPNDPNWFCADGERKDGAE